VGKTKNSVFCNLIFILSFLSIIISGCGYKLGSMTVGGISTLAIVSVENKTDKTFIEEAYVTNVLSQRFNEDGTVKVVNSSIADALLSIKVTKYEQNAQAFSANDVGTDFRVIITAEVTVKRTEDNKVIYHNIIQGESTYESGADQSEIERITVKKAIVDLCIDINRAVLEGGW